MRTSLTVLAVGLLVLATPAITGCGLKGDLYLPENEAAPAPSGTGDEEESDGQSSSPAG